VLRAAAAAPAAPARGALGAVLAASAAAAALGVAVAAVGVHVDRHAAAVAVLAGGREGLHQALAHALAGHLHQAQRGHLGDLVLGAVPAQALHEATQHEIAVRLEDHVDEVDDDDAADVAQPQLAHDLLGRLEVVLGDGLLEGAAGAGELAGVHVDDGHRLGAVDDEGAAGGQVHLAVHRLQPLLVDAVLGEDVLLADMAGDALEQVGGDLGDVGVDVVVDLAALDDQGGEVLVEDVAHHLDGDVGLLREGHGRGPRLLGLLDLLPLGGEALDVAGELLLARALGGGAHDHARVLGDDLPHDLL